MGRVKIDRERELRMQFLREQEDTKLETLLRGLRCYYRSETDYRVCEETVVGKAPDGRRRCAAHGGDSLRVAVLAAQVYWADGWGNGASLNVLLNRIPDTREMLFEEENGCYFAEKDGFVQYLFYKGPGEGFGGAHFRLKMKDGSEHVLVGPWSGGAYGVNKTRFGPVVDVSMTDDVNVLARGHTFVSGHLTLGLALEACQLVQGISLLKYGDTYYPVKLGLRGEVFTAVKEDSIA